MGLALKKVNESQLEEAARKVHNAKTAMAKFRAANLALIQRWEACQVALDKAVAELKVIVKNELDAGQSEELHGIRLRRVVSYTYDPTLLRAKIPHIDSVCPGAFRVAVVPGEIQAAVKAGILAEVDVDACKVVVVQDYGDVRLPKDES